MRTVPDHIPRPDYADHPDGYPASERAARGSTNIIQLSDEEQEGMRVAGKVSCQLSVAEHFHYILSRASKVGSPTNPPWAPGSDKTRGQGSRPSSHNYLYKNLKKRKEPHI